MGRLNFIFFKVILIGFIFFSFPFVALCNNGDNPPFVDQGAHDDPSAFKSGGGNCIWGCWEGYSSKVQGYRVTLVDSDGTRVSYKDSEGNVITTKSVDFQKSGSKNIYVRGNNARVMGSTRINDDYLYKFSSYDSENNSYSNVNSSLDYVMIYLPDDIFPLKTNNLDNFINERILSLNNVKNNYDKTSSAFMYKPIWLGDDEANKLEQNVDFVSLFLHYNGYLSSDETYYFSNPEKRIQLKKYYLIFEPIYWVKFKYGYDGYITRYGTSTEIAFRMLQSNYINLLDGIGGENEIDAMACGTYTYDSPIFENIPKGNCFNTYKNLNGYKSYDKTTRPVNLTNSKYGFGVRAIAMNFGDGGEKSSSLDIIVEKCNLTNNGSLKLSSSFAIKKDIFMNDAFLRSGVDASEVFCYDDVTYDFSNVINSLTKSDVYTYSSLKLENGYAHVKRTCYYKNSYSADQDIKDDYSDLNISLKLTSSDKKDFSYKFDSSIGNIVKKDLRDYEGYKQSSYTFDISFNLNKGLYIDNNFSAGVSSGQIVFPDYDSIFGASNNILSILKNESGNVKSFVVGDNEYIYKLKYSESNNCDFTFNIEEGEPIKDFKFREISLENPFPARDGTSRLPGLNWLNSHNYVFDYITNNRGIIFEHGSSDVSPEAMYSELKPMYSITLTPSIMMNIRSYNKNYSYYSMYDASSYSKVDSDGNETESQKIKDKDSKAYKLNCNENGRECYSTFLRSDIFKDSNFSGTCVDLGDVSGSDLRSNYNSINVSIPDSNFIMSDLINISNGSAEFEYKKERDLNKNGRIDSDDYIISLDQNKNKNTVFYTCANKTFLSGGPVEEG